MGILDTGKDILKIVNGLQNQPLIEKMLSYMDQVFDLQAQNVTLQGENHKLEKDNTKLKELLAFKGKLNRVAEAYQVVDDPNRYICMTCWEKQHDDITLTAQGEMWLCPSCKNYFRSHRHFPDPPQHNRGDYDPYR